LGISAGDHIMIHSSYEALIYWGLNPVEIIDALKNIITPEGIILMPTFVTRNSKDYIKKCNNYNVNRTSSQSGLLSEIFRRQKDVVRSLDPLKPVAAWGNMANEYIKDHHLSVYSYDEESPLFKLCQNNGKVIGLGAPIQNLTLVHTVENIMGESFPIKVYDERVYDFIVVDKQKNTITVKKKILNNPYSRSMNISKFCRNLDKGITKSFLHHFTSYFSCNAKLFLENSIDLAKNGITIYGKF
jgi:aminoglycoside 3-N-acetyltransferase